MNTRPIPVHLRDWLLSTDSLTQRLIDACDGTFAVRVLHKGWQRPLQDERRALGLRDARQAFVRQVYLTCDGRPWVYARTVIPRDSLRGRRKRLTRLGGRSLGEVLFSDPTMCRSEMAVTCLGPGQSVYAMATAGIAERPTSVWGRRSLFKLGGRPLLVSEFFLPPVGYGGCRDVFITTEGTECGGITSL